MMVASGYRRWIWAASAAVGFSSYLVGSGSSTHHVVGIFSASTDVIWRLFAVLGLPFIIDTAVIFGGGTGSGALAYGGADAVLVGLFLMTAIGYAMWLAVRSGPSQHAFSLALMFYGLGSCAMIALGRSDLGPMQALSPRYVTASAITVVGLAFLLAELRIYPPDRDFKVGTVGTAVAVLMLLTGVYGDVVEWPMGRYRRDNLLKWSAAVANYQSATDADLANPHYTPEQIRALSATIERHHLSLFR